MTLAADLEQAQERPPIGGGQPLSPVDAAWFRMGSDTSPADIISLMALEGEVDESRLRAVVEERLLPRRKFRMRVAESPGRTFPPSWEDERSFSLDAHFKRRRIAAPGGEAELTELLVELVNEPMDPERSPWRLWLLDGRPGGSVLVAQIHHCMGDGFALVDILLSLGDAAETASKERGAASTEIGDQSSWVKAEEVAKRVMHGLSDLGHLLLLPFDPPTRLRGPPGGRRLVAWSAGFELARVKALAQTRNVTINDLLLAAFSGALRRYLLRHGDEPRAFRAFVPVNLRSPSEAYDDEHGNRFGLVFVDLPIDESDPEARLSAIKRTVDRIKASEEPIVSLAVLNVFGRSPAVVEHIGNELFARKATLVITNVPGPRDTVFVAGRRIRDMMFWAPHSSGLSLGASILSYAGTVRVGVRSDAAVVPDPEIIAQMFDQELAEWDARVQESPPADGDS